MGTIIMWTHLYNNTVVDNAFNAYFSKDDGTQCNTGIGFDHTPTQEEIDQAVADFMATLE